MPDDRFGDLDPDGRRRREERDGTGETPEESPSGDRGPSAAERLAEMDDRPDSGHDAGERPTAPPPARPGSRYSWVVGIAALVLIAVAAYASLSDGQSGEGFRGPEPGTVLPDFAAASATGDSDLDANIRQAAGGTDVQGAVPACEVEAEDVVNICDLRERPVVLTFVAAGCAEPAFAAVESVRTDFPSVNFVGVISGDPREDLDELLASNDWGFPVAVDPDTAVFNLYRAGDCPTTVLAEEGGEVVETINGPLGEEGLAAAVEQVAGGPAGSRAAR